MLTELEQEYIERNRIKNMKITLKTTFDFIREEYANKIYWLDDFIYHTEYLKKEIIYNNVFLIWSFK